MYLVNLLHFYQPYNQQEDILDRIVHESYLPLINGLLKRSQTKTVINVSGGLLRLLRERNHDEVLEGFRKLYQVGQVEFTGSAMYHAFLPLLPEDEIVRQVALNTEESLRCFGDGFSPVGFFSPEMAVSDRVLRVISSIGYQWIAAPQVAYGSEMPSANHTFVDESTGLSVFFRNKRVSALILSAVVRTASTLMAEARDLFESQKYWFTVMDAETFGHHRVGHERLLFELLDSSDFTTLTVSDVLSLGLETKTVELRPSTWTNEEQDFWLDKDRQKSTEARSFILWKDPKNPIHTLQWSFVDFVLEKVNQYPDKKAPVWDIVRQKLDIALASDQFWWASTTPWWSLEILEQGAFMLKDVMFTLFDSSDVSIYSQTTDFYRKILDQAFEWQRSGYIRKKHLDNSATFQQKPFKDRAPVEWYNQIVLEFEDELNKCAQKQDFERAIKWRDALLKLRNGMDIYDVLHVVDELWTARRIPEVKPFLKHTWPEFSCFAKGHFVPRERKSGSLTEEEFEDWKKSSKKDVTI